MMKRILSLCVCSLAAGVALSPIDAQSATLGGHSGHGWPNSSMSCFQGSWSEMRNSCSANTVLVLPVIVTHTGGTTLTVRARGNGTTNYTTCRAIRNDGNNGGQLTAAVSTSSTSYQTLALGSLSLAAGDTLSFECNVAPTSGAVLNVNWT